MSLKFSLQNTKLTSMDQEVSDYLWYEFHGGNLNDADDFYVLLHEWIDNQVIYYSECEAILEGNWEYHYDEHDLYGRPENIAQAAYACLYDYLLDSPDTVTWADMEEVLATVEMEKELKE
jgi:hypothetical protein